MKGKIHYFPIDFLEKKEMSKEKMKMNKMCFYFFNDFHCDYLILFLQYMIIFKGFQAFFTLILLVLFIFQLLIFIVSMIYLKKYSQTEILLLLHVYIPFQLTYLKSSFQEDQIHQINYFYCLLSNVFIFYISYFEC